MATKKSKSKITIYTREVKTVKGVPTLVLVDQKVPNEDAAEKKLIELQANNEEYIVVENNITGIKTVWTKRKFSQNYTKKDIKL